MKCMMAQKKYYFDEEVLRHREQLLAMPLRELAGRELPDDDRYALAEVDRAARLDKPDWQSLERLKIEGFNLLLPEVQQIRSVARALQVRLRAEIAQGRFDEAIRTSKTMFAIARHLSENPTAIGNLVGIAVAAITISNFDDLVQQPGCPNLYWALTNLPSPLVPLDKGLEGERLSLVWAVGGVDANAPMSKDQLEAFIKHLETLFELAEQNADKSRVRTWLKERIKDEALVSAARRRLVTYGLSEERLLKFPAEQVLFLDEKRELDIRVDDAMKTFRIPIWLVEMRDDEAARSKKPQTLFADTLMPALTAVRKAEARISQRIALLRHVEALRLHAAAHGGKLPAKLTDIAVPLPADPITGKPFRYEVSGDTAHLRGTPPAGQEKVPAYNIHYEISFSS